VALDVRKRYLLCRMYQVAHQETHPRVSRAGYETMKVSSGETARFRPAISVPRAYFTIRLRPQIISSIRWTSVSSFPENRPVGPSPFVLGQNPTARESTRRFAKKVCRSMNSVLLG
jgi:hypothetical protein